MNLRVSQIDKAACVRMSLFLAAHATEKGQHETCFCGGHQADQVGPQAAGTERASGQAVLGVQKQNAAPAQLQGSPPPSHQQPRVSDPGIKLIHRHKALLVITSKFTG